MGKQWQHIRTGAVFIDRPQSRSDIVGAATAVARDHRGHALFQIICIQPRGSLDDRAVTVGMQVDEAGRGYQTSAVKLARFTLDHKATDRHDPLTSHGDVAWKRCAA